MSARRRTPPSGCNRRLEPTRAIRFVERDRDRGCRCIPIAIDIDEEPLDRDLHPIGDRFDDPDVRLVRDDAGDVLDVSPAFSSALYEASIIEVTACL
jgi:hypothetical protein